MQPRRLRILGISYGLKQNPRTALPSQDGQRFSEFFEESVVNPSAEGTGFDSRNFRLSKSLNVAPRKEVGRAGAGFANCPLLDGTRKGGPTCSEFRSMGEAARGGVRFACVVDPHPKDALLGQSRGFSFSVRQARATQDKGQGFSEFPSLQIKLVRKRRKRKPGFHLFPHLTNIVAIAQNERRRPVVRRIRRPFPVAAPFVNVIYQDRAGTLWIGVVTAERPGALYCLCDGKLERISGISGVSHMIEDRDGRDRKISAPPGNNTFDFRFTALSLSAPERCASSNGSNHTTRSGWTPARDVLHIIRTWLPANTRSA